MEMLFLIMHVIIPWKLRISPVQCLISYNWSNKEKLYQEVGLESLQHRHWFHKLSSFYKIFKNQSPHYLYELLLLQTTSNNTRSSRNITLFHLKHKFFKNFFFSFGNNWMEQSKPNNQSKIYSKFRKFEYFKKILKFIRPSANST